MHDEVNGWIGDVLQRKKYADFLTQYLVAKKDPFVININAPKPFLLSIGTKI